MFCLKLWNCFNSVGLNLFGFTWISVDFIWISLDFTWISQVWILLGFHRFSGNPPDGESPAGASPFRPMATAARHLSVADPWVCAGISVVFIARILVLSRPKMTSHFEVAHHPGVKKTTDRGGLVFWFKSLGF